MDTQKDLTGPVCIYVMQIVQRMQGTAFMSSYKINVKCMFFQVSFFLRHCFLYINNSWKVHQRKLTLVMKNSI